MKIYYYKFGLIGFLLLTFIFLAISPAVAKQTDLATRRNEAIDKVLSDLDSNWCQAVKEAHLLDRKFQSSSDVAAVCGIAYMRSGNVTEARRQLSIAESLGQGSIWELVLKGRILLWDYHTSDALEILAQAIEKNPLSLTVWRAFYTAYYADMNVTKAFLVSHSTSKVVKELKEPGKIDDISIGYALPNDTLGSNIVNIEVPFTYDANGRFWVKILVNGEPMRLLLDTGGGGLVLTKSASQRAKLQTTSGLGQIAGGGGIERVMIMQANNVVIGSTLAKSVPIRVLSEHDKEDLGDGIFGTPILRNFDVVFDMEKMTIRIMSKRNAAFSHPSYSIPFHLIRGVPLLYSKVNETNCIGTLDTGDKSIQLSYNLANSLSVDGIKQSNKTIAPPESIGVTSPEIISVYSPQNCRVGIVANERMYDLIISPMQGTSAIDSISADIDFEIGLNLGTPFFRMQRIIEIDYPNNMIYITKLSGF